MGTPFLACWRRPLTSGNGVECVTDIQCVMNSGEIFIEKSWLKIWSVRKKCLTLHRFRQERALSSAGSERLPYKQRVGGSNPSAPTKPNFRWSLAFFVHVCVWRPGSIILIKVLREDAIVAAHDIVLSEDSTLCCHSLIPTNRIRSW